VRYLDVAGQLRARLALGDVGSGGALPSESDLSREFAASRVTVRRALELLRSEGLVTSRRGSGWFAASDPVRQALGRVTTVEAALEAAGSVPARKVLEFGFESASVEVARALELRRGADVLRVKRLNLADGEPFALVTVWLPGEVGAEISRAEVEVATFYDLLPLRGVALGRAVQQIGADRPTTDDLRHLGLDRSAAILTARRVTYTVDHRPVLFSLHRYPGARTSVEIELPSLAFETIPRDRIRHAQG
jgi:GntR family transcriptional regulator